MDMGVPSAGGTNVTLLPITDPRCDSEACPAFKTAEDASQAQISWASQFLYGEWTAWYGLVWIALFSLAYVARLGRARMRTKRRELISRPAHPSAWDKVLAETRFWTYRRLSGAVGRVLSVSSLGVVLLLLLALGYVTGLAFKQHPYYREKRGYGSPPLAVRTGLMSTALIPFIVALSGKFNLITLVTGISYERLNVFHRWLGWMCLYLACIHTVPFFLCLVREGGARNLHDKFYAAGAYEYTGVAPFAILFFSTASSLSFVRRWIYEIWSALHWLSAALFLAFMFWHCDNEGNSWSYLWVTTGLWLMQVLGRAFSETTVFPLRKVWFQSAPTHVQYFPGGAVKLTVRVPDTFRCSAGQHVFLRFPGFSTLHNHPFTIADLTQTEDADGKFTPETVMTFLVRGRQGFTGALLRQAESHSSQPLRAWVDGPYGHQNDIGATFDNALLVAGGVGITACLPWLTSLARKLQKSPEDTSCRRIHLIWVIKRRDALSWFQNEILQALQTASHEGAVTVEVWITQEQPLVDDTSSSEKDCAPVERGKDRPLVDIEAACSTTSSQQALLAQQIPLRGGRPLLPKVVSRIVQDWSGRTWILGSGPEGLKIDLSNTAANLQRRILHNHDEPRQTLEVALHTETFGW